MHPNATARFVSKQSDPRSRGRELGHAFAREVRGTWAAYQQVFTTHGLDEALVREVSDQARDQVLTWGPCQVEEIDGIAEGSGLEPWQVMAVNARSEVLARYRSPVPGECSTSVSLPEDGSPRTVQTWDWHEAFRGRTLAWQLEPQPGRVVKTFTEFGLLGKIGVTNAGLAVHFNLLQHDADGQQPGVPVHLLSRRILDEAASIAEAEALVRSTPVSASVALTLVQYDGRAGEAVTLEAAPTGVRRVEAVDGLLLHANHFVHPDLAPHDRLARSDADTHARQEMLGRRADALRSADLEVRAAAMECHESDGAGLCCHPGGPDDLTMRWLTIATIALDVEKGQLSLRDGSPCQATGGPWTEV